LRFSSLSEPSCCSRKAKDAKIAEALAKADAVSGSAPDLMAGASAAVVASQGTRSRSLHVDPDPPHLWNHPTELLDKHRTRIPLESAERVVGLSKYRFELALDMSPKAWKDDEKAQNSVKSELGSILGVPAVRQPSFSAMPRLDNCHTRADTVPLTPSLSWLHHQV
jgi:hypothetical protein